MCTSRNSRSSIDRQRREFDRVKAELQAAHTKRVAAKTRVELRVPQEAISPLRDLGSAALRPGIPTVLPPTRPGGSLPVFKGVLKELKAIRKEDARKASLKGLSGLGFGTFKDEPEQEEPLPAVTPAAGHVMPIPPHTDADLDAVFTGMEKVKISPPKAVESEPVTVDSPFPDPMSETRRR